MPSFRTGRVTRLVSHRRGLQRVEVDGEAAFALTDLVGPLGEGDRVVVNTTAVELGLGTGGAHVVHWNLERSDLRLAGPGHVMKLRYTSVQLDAGAWNEDEAVPAAEAVGTPPDLGGLPVVVLLLHSHLAPVAAAASVLEPSARVAWVMDDTAALPAALSDVAATLVDAGLLHDVISCGQAFGGRHEAVNVVHGLELAARSADIAVVGPGPGVVGTGSAVGFSSLSAAAHLDLAGAVGGRTALVARAGGSDGRRRHRGISHHTVTVLALASRPTVVPVPAGDLGDRAQDLLTASLGHHRTRRVPPTQVTGVLASAGIEPTSMGRRLADDPLALGLAAAGGAWAGTLLGA